MKRNTALNSQRTNDPIPLNIALIISVSFHPVALVVVRGLHLGGLGCYGASSTSGATPIASAMRTELAASLSSAFER